MTVSELRRLAERRKRQHADVALGPDSLLALLACVEAAQGLTTELAAKSDSEVTASLAALDAALAALDGEQRVQS